MEKEKKIKVDKEKVLNYTLIATLTTIISFVIKPPFYKTWWFIMSIFGGLISIIFVFFKYRLHSIKKQNQILTEKIELESALQKSTLTGIKAQMNPHFIFNIKTYVYYSKLCLIYAN